MTPTRRNLLLAGAGLAAAGLGGGLAWRQQQRATDLSEAARAFWAASFESTDGSAPLAAQRFAGKPLLLNFWATWCAPCIKEMPEIDQFQREFQARGWQVLGLAVDSAAPVREFLKKTPVGFPTALAGLTGLELTRKLGNLQGGLPFSVAFDRAGEVSWRKLGPTNLAELRLLGGTAG